MPDRATITYRAASVVARLVPPRLVIPLAAVLGDIAWLVQGRARRMATSHQRRVTPGLQGAGLRRRVRAVFRSYARYWLEAFRLPTLSPEEAGRRMSHEGFEHVLRARRAGCGAILVLPHLGSWETCAHWLALHKQIPISAVAERLEPPELFEWFRDLRASMGTNVIPLGPDAGREVMQALARNEVVALLADRDVAGNGVAVELFGERTTLPAGPAALALRTGAPLLAVAVYDRPDGQHAVVRPPIPVQRRGSFREDVVRLTACIANELEELIRQAPEQWHLLQPNWPGDRDLWASAGRRRPGT